MVLRRILPTGLQGFLILSLVLMANCKAVFANVSGKNTGIMATWISFLKTLNYSTIQVFYYHTDYDSWDIISNELQNLNLPSFNFVIENFIIQTNRYYRTFGLKLDVHGHGIKTSHSQATISTKCILIARHHNFITLKFGTAAIRNVRI